MPYKYSFQGFDKEKMARAVGRSLPISPKKSMEICSLLRKKDVRQAKNLLELAIDMKRAIPFKRFNKGAGHRRAVGPGKYAPKTAGYILALLKSAEANAAQKGINNPFIISMNANRAGKVSHYGRQSGRKEKIAHVEIILAEKPKIIKEEKIGAKKQ